MVGSNDEPKLLLPALKPFYDFVIPLSWFVVRAAAGWNLLVHSWGKITVGPASGFLKAFVDIGFTPPAPGSGYRSYPESGFTFPPLPITSKRTSGAKLELVANYLLIPETASDTTPST